MTPSTATFSEIGAKDVRQSDIVFIRATTQGEVRALIRQRCRLGHRYAAAR